MFQPTPSNSHHLTFSQVTRRLSQNDIVTGLIVIGSASQNKLTPASDYDLVVVLAEMPLPLHVGVTYIEGRFTDLIFVTAAQIEEIIALADPVSGEVWLGRTIRWLEVGTIIFDRSERLKGAQQKVKGGNWLRPMDENDGYGPWATINYNLAQTRRLFTSDDPLYQMTAAVRIALYGPADLFFNYFTIRKLRWEGDKEAIRYLLAHDPAYLRLFQHFMVEPDQARKLQLYEELAELTVSPVGDIWPGDMTVMSFEEKVGADMVQKALAFWESLLAGGD